VADAVTGVVDVTTAELWVAPWRCALRAPLHIGSEVVQARAGVVVVARMDDRVGLGDAAPLPGLSSDSIDDMAVALAAISAGRSAYPEGLPPSLSFAISSALLELKNYRSDVQVHTALLLTDTDVGRVVEAAASAVVVKLKVGRRSVDEECRAIIRLRQRGYAVRLDGNRRLDVDATVALADAAGDALRFFEEPVPVALWGKLPTSLPLALDETFDELSRPSLAALSALPAAAAWVLKPTVLGAATTTMLLSAAKAKGVTVVISSAYESRVGRRALALSASALPDTAHGLDTGAAFATDIMDGVLDERPGILRVRPAPTWSSLLAADGLLWRRVR